ncbi:MAG: hypothetical protein K2R98_00690 [Gemmataceae bacterium]|nr:hypothetical protein [Gemmataceae bacterium]
MLAFAGRETVALVLLCAIGLGCASAPSTVEPDTRGQNLARIARAYAQATKSLGHPPRSDDELLPYLKSQGDAEALRRSPVDGQPYVILWNVDMEAGTPGSTQPVVIAYEKQGEKGTRLVLTAVGVRRITEKEFREANFPNGHQPGGL